MEKVLAILAAALLAGSAAADPPKNATARPTGTRPSPTEVVLASTETPRAPTPENQPNAEPAKRRVARVTTCRCGDPQTEPESQEQ
jgi:hypothetical protein